MTRELLSIVDTARWAAAYRAAESARPDALFRDPLAARLVGGGGDRLIAATPAGEPYAWAPVLRTALVDALLLAQVHAGADLVLDLGAGLDTRPYRLDLPDALRWIEADLPAVVRYKDAVLRDVGPRCQLDREPIDLTDVVAIRTLLRRVAAPSRRAVVVTEGLLIYLAPAEVARMAEALLSVPACRYWILDLQSPELLRVLRRHLAHVLEGVGAELRFGPTEGAEFLAAHGWRVAEAHSILAAAARVGRVPASWRGRGARAPRIDGTVYGLVPDARHVTAEMADGDR